MRNTLYSISLSFWTLFTLLSRFYFRSSGIYTATTELSGNHHQNFMQLLKLFLRALPFLLNCYCLATQTLRRPISRACNFTSSHPATHQVINRILARLFKKQGALTLEKKRGACIVCLVPAAVAGVAGQAFVRVGDAMTNFVRAGGAA